MDPYSQHGVCDQLRNRTKYSYRSSRTRRSRDEKTNERSFTFVSLDLTTSS